MAASFYGKEVLYVAFSEDQELAPSLENSLNVIYVLINHNYFRYIKYILFLPDGYVGFLLESWHALVWQLRERSLEGMRLKKD